VDVPERKRSDEIGAREALALETGHATHLRRGGPRWEGWRISTAFTSERTRRRSRPGLDAAGWILAMVGARPESRRPGRRRTRRDIGIAVGLLVLYIVQTMLPNARMSAPWIAALHPVNALFLFGLAVWYARRTWRAAMA